MGFEVFPRQFVRHEKVMRVFLCVTQDQDLSPSHCYLLIKDEEWEGRDGGRERVLTEVGYP